MSIGSPLYTFLIGPLKLLFEVIYSVSYYLTGSAGISIIALSMVMNILLLPLYNMADKIHEEEKKTQEKLRKGIDHIKKTFKGDEQYMILSTYYRQNDYKPIYALRNSISLLLEIPFFIAAYDFLSNEYTVLSSSFGPIASLGNPDQLLGGINLLPILMTLINIISSIIYTKGQPLKNNIQLYVMALAFLVLLYDRPAGLVFYWTLNNLFSLIKNIFIRIKNSGLILGIACSLISLIGLIYVIFIHPLSTVTMMIGVVVVLLAMQLPLVYELFLKNKININTETNKPDSRLFYLELILLIVLFGLYIPFEVVGSSPAEFVDVNTLVSPLTYLLNSFVLVAGTFGVWFLIYYSLMNNTVKRIMQYVLLVVGIVATVNYMFFGRDMGTMSNMLVYEKGLTYANNEGLYNVLAIGIVVAVISFIYFRKKKYCQILIAILCISMSVSSVVKYFDIRKDANETIKAIESSKKDTAQINLSKNGKNVVLIVLDRAIDYYFPYIINEKPQLKESYSGFTYYPNTISYGPATNTCIPSVFGGYEYTPYEMDQRSDEYLVDKHNEALKVLPVLFDNNDFNVTVFDPSYANYKTVGDLSIYDEYPNINKYTTQAGMFAYDPGLSSNNLETLNRNFFCFGIVKAAPIFLQNILYNGGAYNSVSRYSAMFGDDSFNSRSSQAFVNQGFLNSFPVIENMINITKVNNDETGDLLMMYNYAPHEPTLLQEPDYKVQTNVDNYEFDKKTDYSRTDENGEKVTFETYDQMSHYHVNMATIIELGKWFDYLKEIGVYDNTRIIVTADHAANLHQYENLIFEFSDGQKEDLMKYNPLLLVKDFNSKEFKTDNSLMSNADAPYLAVKDLIKDPVNPFTGKIINDEKKNVEYQRIFVTEEISIKTNNGKTFIPGRYLFVKDNIFDINNWSENPDQ